jgi:hypothetical protein
MRASTLRASQGPYLTSLSILVKSICSRWAHRWTTTWAALLVHQLVPVRAFKGPWSLRQTTSSATLPRNNRAAVSACFTLMETHWMEIWELISQASSKQLLVVFSNLICASNSHQILRHLGAQSTTISRLWLQSKSPSVSGWASSNFSK